MPSDWINPNSAVANGWSNPALAYDDSVSTYAYYNVPQQQWSPYLELWLNKDALCTKVRVYSQRSASPIDIINVHVWYGNAWHDIYWGALTVGAFVEYPIGSEQLVKAMRVRYYNISFSATWQARCCEADFYGYYLATGRSFGFIIG